jgi:hypothetical protein
MEGAGRAGKWDEDPHLLLALLKDTFEESCAAIEAFIAANKA